MCKFSVTAAVVLVLLHVIVGTAVAAGEDAKALGVGQALRKTKQYARAARHYQEMVSADPASVPARLGLGLTQVALDDHEAAERTFRHFADSVVGRGRLIRTYRIRAAEDAADPTPAFLLGCLLNAKGACSNAVEALTTASERLTKTQREEEPEFYRATHHQLAIAYQGMGKLSEAARYFHRSGDKKRTVEVCTQASPASLACFSRSIFR